MNTNIIPNEIGKYLPIVADIFFKVGKVEISTIVKNSQVEVIENYHYDNYNGGINGHKILLHIRKSLYIQYYSSKKQYEEDILSLLREMFEYVNNESITELNIVPIPSDADSDDIEESGIALKSKLRIRENETIVRIWEEPNKFRVFISHKSEDKILATTIKKSLKEFGITCFVAHEDIEVSQEWQSDIESALFSADAFIAILTTNFHDSIWTDQEVGIAIGRGIPILLLKMGIDPYGFIGKFQALKYTNSDYLKIASSFLKYSKMFEIFIELLEKSNSFNQSIRLSSLLDNITYLKDEEVYKLLEVYGKNNQLYNSGTFTKNLREFLKKVTGKEYNFQDYRPNLYHSEELKI